LTEAWWSLLEAVDPDVVKSFMTFSDDLVASIERRISRYLIQQPDRLEQEQEYRYLHLYNNGISIPPTPRNIQTLSEVIIGESSLVLFETNWQRTDPIIKRFTEWNFGGYSPPIYAVKRAGACSQATLHGHRYGQPC
jgi:hypothetical protein